MGFELTAAAEKAFKQKRTPAACHYADEKAFQDEINVMDKIKELSPAGFQQFLLRGSGVPTPSVVEKPPSPVAAAAPVVEKPPTPVAAAAPVVQPDVEEFPAMTPEVVETAPAPGPELTEAVAPEAAVPEAEAEQV